MKKMILLAVVAISASSAFAQTCEVNMVDRYNRVVRYFRAYGDQNSCVEGMKQCRKAIRLDYSNNPQYPNGSLDCVRVVTPVPGPIPPTRPIPAPPVPTPIPTPAPNPYPGSYDAQRMLNPGESVIYNNSYYSVIGTAFNGSVALKSNYGSISQNIPRSSVAVTQGCNGEICVAEQVIDVLNASYKTVAGLTYDNGFVLKSNYGSLMTVALNAVAQTKGCSYSRYSTQICVGNQVLASNNSYYSVVGIQMDGRIVLKSNYGSLTVNVNPESLIVTR
jgi:hypothetical protein